MKRYFVRYTEARSNLKISASPTLVIQTSFNAGVNISRHGGHARKKDAISWIEQVNAAAGKVIAYYHGVEVV
ncbi:hypothetical protein GCM10011607_12070 [Shewanella inventionis]|uniref:Uncharacterized protein n=1 Tax=Shewanella inventionis TaxID=1738770 RepID=A0ABQ1IWY6_9GAMM|nr:hypothetical protein [Shewanella inventionis]GGB53142.1 hypothetical protein GCM10011607_12070 [Shewanella inventionis]